MRPRNSAQTLPEKGLGHRLSFFEVDDTDFRRFPRLARALRRLAPPALRKFYSKVAHTPEISGLFANAAAMDAASSKQLAHWVDLFEQNQNGLTEDFHRRASAIGDVHARIGLEPTWYTGAYATILGEVITGMARGTLAGRLSGSLAADIATLVKLAILDMDVALGAYFRAEEAKRLAVIDQLSEALAALARGDFARPLAQLPPEYAKLQRDFEAMRGEVSNAMAGVARVTSSINTGSAEILSASDNLASRTEAQAGALEEATSAIHELTSGTGEAARGAGQVESTVAEAQEEADKGSAVVREAVTAMANIEASAREITQIINVIDGIAFQTNLLALNAGVEAARAGDAGKGFAVVASEVRALAQRSGEAAKDIRALIGTSVDQVTHGVALVDQSGQAFTRIASKVSDIAGLAIVIARLGREQAETLAQINESVHEIDQNTQSNAAMAEQATAAARGLADQAKTLNKLIERFSIAGQSAAPVEVPAATERFTPKPRLRAVGQASAAAQEDWSEF